MIQKGNIPEKIQTHPETRGWFMGKFFPQNDFFHSKNIELKFHAYKKGESHIGSTTSKYRKTLAILISGKIIMRFGEQLDKEYVLENPFDFIADDEIPGSHSVEALEDSVILVVREQFEN